MVPNINQLAALLTYSFEHFYDRKAVVSSEGSWTYAELQQERETFIDLFSGLGLTSGDAIGILLPKSFSFLACMTAAIAKEQVYVPLDIENPATRINYILQNANCSLLVVQTADKDRFGAFLPRILEECQYGNLSLLLLERKTIKVEPLKLSYVLYTSGSTGQPKGVGISDQNASCFVDWAADAFQLSQNDVVASIAPFHFDLSIFDVFATLKTGSCLFLLRQDECRNPKLIAKLLSDQKVSCLYATPSFLQLLLRYGKLDRYDFSALRLVLFAGEVFPVEPLRRLKSTWQQVDFYNLYGPTETNVVTWHPIPANVPLSQGVPYPIGRLCPYAEGRILHAGEIHSFQAELEGELLIAGTSVTSGYLADEAKNETAFLELDGQRWYKTGDIVRLAVDGLTLSYKGRADRMIKRHGYRIELAELELALEKHPAVASLAAIGSTKKDKKEVVIFFQLKAGSIAPTFVEWKQYSSGVLPSYMVPDRFVPIEHWPYTPSQKLDFQQLQQLASS